MSETEPPDVAALREVLQGLPGLSEVQAGLDLGDLSLASMADLPSGALRRAGGGLPGESVIQVWIGMERAQESWTTLAFLAWYARDSCRAGDVAQMRVRGLAPRVGDHVQIGTTLLFVIEWFVVHPEGDLEPLLKRIREETESLSVSIRHYGDLIGARAES
jgi:hypothetical protein